MFLGNRVGGGALNSDLNPTMPTIYDSFDVYVTTVSRCQPTLVHLLI
jgi:hypothetical protein